ncbi:MAG: hypothetical protein Q8881_03325 [Sweet potato little leaf phytoplasma]|nr:hypothetical protein [Sweet potato little leaf phytoplasma]
MLSGTFPTRPPNKSRRISHWGRFRRNGRISAEFCTGDFSDEMAESIPLNFCRISLSRMFLKKRQNFCRISHWGTFPPTRPNFRRISIFFIF